MAEQGRSDRSRRGGQSRPELRSRGLVGRGSLQPKALISGPGNNVVAVLNATLIGNGFRAPPRAQAAGASQ